MTRRFHSHPSGSMTASILLLTAGLLTTSARPAAAQIAHDSVRLQQVTAAGSHIVHWTFDEGIEQQTIYLKNIGKDRPVIITAWRVFDCENIKRRSCREHKEGPTLEPGETVRLGTVQRDNEELGYSYRYEFAAAYTDEQEGE